MDGFTNWGRILLGAVALACVVAVVPAATAAVRHHNHVKLALNPNTGKNGTIYKIHVTGYVTKRDESLALDMVSSPSTPCPKSYTSGFSKLFGLSNSKGKPIGILRVRKGKLDEIIKAKITTGDVGAWSICGYLVVGPQTKAHGSSVLTITD